MGFNVRMMNGVLAASGNLNTVGAGSSTGGNTLTMADVQPGTLSATFTVDAETSTLTIAAIWEVSADGTNWNRAVDANNSSPTVLATGTGGADAAVTRVVAAPASVYGWRFARAAALVGVTTGTTSDTYAIAYNYVKPDFV